MKSVAEKATVLLEKQVTVRARSMFCVLVIVGGLAIAVNQPKDTGSTTVTWMEEAVSLTGAMLILFLLMVVYKKVNRIQVVW